MITAEQRLIDSQTLLRHALEGLVESHERNIRESESREPEPTEAVGRAVFDGMKDFWVLILYAKQSQKIEPEEIGGILNGMFVALDRAFREVAMAHPTDQAPPITDGATDAD